MGGEGVKLKVKLHNTNPRASAVAYLNKNALSPATKKLLRQHAGKKKTFGRLLINGQPVSIFAMTINEYHHNIVVSVPRAVADLLRNDVYYSEIEVKPEEIVVHIKEEVAVAPTAATSTSQRR